MSNYLGSPQQQAGLANLAAMNAQASTLANAAMQNAANQFNACQAAQFGANAQNAATLQQMAQMTADGRYVAPQIGQSNHFSPDPHFAGRQFGRPEFDSLVLLLL